jgi:hypothetical protein
MTAIIWLLEKASLQGEEEIRIARGWDYSALL